MCNSNSCGCCLLNNFANAINNLFSTEPYCGCPRRGCGCGCSTPVTTFTNGFLSGVNAANAVNNCGCGNQNNCGCGNQNGCGCNQNGNGGIAPVNNNGCGCGANADLSAYTNCGNGCYDAYYAQQYGLYPFNTGNGICSCCNN